jgi:hypothetical protein
LERSGLLLNAPICTLYTIFKLLASAEDVEFDEPEAELLLEFLVVVPVVELLELEALVFLSVFEFELFIELVAFSFLLLDAELPDPVLLVLLFTVKEFVEFELLLVFVVVLLFSLVFAELFCSVLFFELVAELELLAEFELEELFFEFEAMAEFELSDLF